MHSTAVRTSGSAVIRITASDSSTDSKRGSTTGPGSPGSRTSRKTTSTRRARSTSSAAAPSSTPSTSNSRRRISRIASWTAGSSSTTSATGRGRYVGAGSVTSGGRRGSPGGSLEDHELVGAAAALELHGGAVARAHRRHGLLEALDARHRTPVDLEDGVAGADARLRARAAGRDRGHHDARARGELEALRRLGRERLDGEAEALLARPRLHH